MISNHIQLVAAATSFGLFALHGEAAEMGVKIPVFGGPIVTEVTPLNVFCKAEDYHQDYAMLHPDQAYIAYNDLPKIANLKAMFAGGRSRWSCLQQTPCRQKKEAGVGAPERESTDRCGRQSRLNRLIDRRS